MNEQDLALIERVKSDLDFPKKYVPSERFYVENGRVYQNFTNSNGKPMRRVFRFGKYNMDGKYKNGPQVRGDFEVLIYSSEFINVEDEIESYFANVSDEQLKKDMEKAEFDKYNKIGSPVDSNWIKNQGDKLIEFLKTAPKEEVDKLLKDSHFKEILDNQMDAPDWVKQLINKNFHELL